MTVLPVKEFSFFEQSKNSCYHRSLSVDLSPPKIDGEYGTFVILFNTISLFEKGETRSTISGIVDRTSSNTYFLLVKKIVATRDSVLQDNVSDWAGFDLLIFDEKQQFSTLDREREILHAMTSGTEPNFDAVLRLCFCSENDRWAYPNTYFISLGQE